MPALKTDLSRWFDEGVTQGATHMIVKCDTFEYRGSPYDKCCYPVYVMPGDDVHKVDDANNDKTMEVYSFAKTKDEQLQTTRRVFNYE